MAPQNRALKETEDKALKETEDKALSGEVLDKDDNFVLERREYRFTLEDPETHEKKKYMIREANGLGRDAYLQCVNNRSRFVDGRPAGLKDVKGLYADLLTKTMIDLETGELVTERFVQALPSSVQTTLFNKSKNLSGLGDEDAEKVKND